MRMMSEQEMEEARRNERENGCCECGEKGHACDDCPVFGWDNADWPAFEKPT